LRTGVYERETKETKIRLAINLDDHENHVIQVNKNSFNAKNSPEVKNRPEAKNTPQINTGIGFFDHMLELFAFRAGIALKVDCQGDLHIDGHHTVEDVGICLGRALELALGDKSGIKRYGEASVPMDESLVHCVLDISGRGFLVFNADIPSKIVGGFETELTEEFFRAIAHNAGITLHINLRYGSNTHHIIEAMFKAFGLAVAQAICTIGQNTLTSTKGVV